MVDRRRSRALIAPVLGLALLALTAMAARAASFVADLSDHLIAITTAFTGTDVLLFGAVDTPGSGVAVVVRGPAANAVVRHKSKVGPIWLFTDQVTFAAVPSYYAVATSQPLLELSVVSELARHQIGVDHLELNPVAGEDVDRADLAEFRAAFIRGKQQERLYPAQVGTVSFLGGTLFRTRLAFPANVAPGTYQVQVFQFMDGRVINAQTSALDISKIGLEAELYDFARRWPASYALAAILLAISSGWIAATVFRRA